MGRPRRAWAVCAVLTFLVLCAVLVRLAWVGDDGFITLRTVENWIGGHGLVWNAAERVQTYTHPLWMFVLAGARVVTGEIYFGTLAVSFVFAAAAAVVVARLGGTWAGATVALLVLLASRSLTEYAVSGLENPLVYLLVALFAAVTLREERPERRFLLSCLIAALLATTRLDLGLLAAPALVASLRGVAPRRAIRLGALGFAPLLAWLAFAIVYYGSPFPVTAHAKAFDTGVPAGDLLRQGGWYLVYVARTDPWTAMVLLAAPAVAFARRVRGEVSLALGAWLYLAYVVKVGGDFMGGRFVTPSFVLAAVLVARAVSRASDPRVPTALAAVALLACLVPRLPAWAEPRTAERQGAVFHGISDERRHYWRTYGLFSSERDLPRAGAFSAVLREHGRTRLAIDPGGVAGRAGLEAGPLVHVVDPWLLDPLLMRLPIGKPGHWRIGHFERAIPVGYYETLAHGTDRLQHEGLARYHANLRSAISGPLFTRRRWDALFKLWTRAYDDELDDFVETLYRTPRRPVVSLLDVVQPLPPSFLGTGAYWFDEPQAHVVYPVGLEVRFPTAMELTALDVELQGGDWLSHEITGRRSRYRLSLLAHGVTVGESWVDTTDSHRHWGMSRHRVELPGDLPAIDAVVIEAPDCPPIEIAAFGSLRVVPRGSD